MHIHIHVRVCVHVFIIYVRVCISMCAFMYACRTGKPGRNDTRLRPVTNGSVVILVLSIDIDTKYFLIGARIQKKNRTFKYNSNTMILVFDPLLLLTTHL